MTNSSRSQKPQKEKWYENQALVLTLLGAGATIIAAIITILPQILDAFQKPEPTQTAIPITATMEMTPTFPPATLTATETLIPFTVTISPTPTETATLTPVSPPISCLDRWQIVSSDSDLTGTSDSGNCSVASIPALGISASRNGVSFGVNSFRGQGTFGIATPLPADATISLNVSLTALTQGEFWIALSNTANPEDHMVIMALQPQNGELRTYTNQTNNFVGKYKWGDLISNTNLTTGPPYTYGIKFSISGNKVSPQIYFTNLPAQFVNLPKYLFLGYSKKSSLGSMTVQVEITDLLVEIQ
jgi:hypothetical protein